MNNYIEQVKLTYLKTKHILDVLDTEDIDRSELKQELMKHLTTDKVENMRIFIKDLEDMGIHLLLSKDSN